MPDEAATKCIEQSVATFLGGGFVGAILGHFLAIGRDNRNRKQAAKSAREGRIRDFTANMSGVRSWMERSSLGQLGESFDRVIHEVRTEAARITDDVADKARFDAAVTALCRLRASEVCEYTSENGAIKLVGKERLASAIDAVVAAAK